MITTGTANIIYVFDSECPHQYDIRLGCEPHYYLHLWGWACSICGAQCFYPDDLLDWICENEAAM